MQAFLFLMTLVGAPEWVETKFVQVHPPAKDTLERTPGRQRAVLLLHGLRLHPLNGAKIFEPEFHEWQRPGSLLVRTLGREADVFAFAYAQNTRVEKIADMAALANAIGKLRFLGYPEIVLVGHSTGGVVARLFVEDHPHGGVTKVIQICAPNDGTSWAKLRLGGKEQEPLMQSITKKTADTLE